MKGITFVGLVLIVGSFVGIGWERNRAKKDAPANDVTTVYAKSPWRLSVPTQGASVRGYHRWQSVEATFEPYDGGSVPLRARGIQERRWSTLPDLDEYSVEPERIGEPIGAQVELASDPATFPSNTVGQVKVKGQLETLPVVVNREAQEYSAKPALLPVESTFSVVVRSGEVPQKSGISNKDQASPLQLALTVTFLLGIGLLLLRLVGWRILTIGLGMIFTPIFVMTTFFDGTTESIARQESFLTGGSQDFNVDVDQASVDGYHRLANLSAWLQGVEDDQIELPVEAASHKPWPDTIQVATVRVGPIFKSNRTGIEGKLRVQMPNPALYIGKEATLVLAGSVEYPDIDAVDTLNPLLSKFGVASKRWSWTRTFQFADSDGQGNAKPARAFPKWLFVFTGLGILLLLVTTLLSIFGKLGERS